MKCPDGGEQCHEAYCRVNGRCMSRDMEAGNYSVRDDPEPGPWFPGDDPFSNADRN